MSSRWQAVCLAGLFVGCAAVLGVGCSDDSSKKVTPDSNEGGEAGEAAGGAAPGSGDTTGMGGEDLTPGAAGQGGAPTDGAAGAPAAGAPSTPSIAGAGGEPDLGAAGAGPIACGEPGSVNNLSIPAQARQTVCRGTYQVFDFLASTTAAAFTCCSALAPISGIGGDGSGQFVFTVPNDAPFGNQSVAVTCSEGPVSGTLDIDVSETALAPEVDGLERGTIVQGDPLQIDGLHLDLVSHVTVVSVDNPSFSADCQIDPEQLTSSTLVCNLGGNIPPGDYSVVVEEDDCGFVVNSPIVTIQQNT